MQVLEVHASSVAACQRSCWCMGPCSMKSSMMQLALAGQHNAPLTTGNVSAAAAATACLSAAGERPWLLLDGAPFEQLPCAEYALAWQI